MNPALASFLITTATKVGAPVIKQLLERHVGGTASDIGATVIDAIAAKAGERCCHRLRHCCCHRSFDHDDADGLVLGLYMGGHTVKDALVSHYRFAFITKLTMPVVFLNR